MKRLAWSTGTLRTKMESGCFWLKRSRMGSALAGVGPEDMPARSDSGVVVERCAVAVGVLERAYGFGEFVVEQIRVAEGKVSGGGGFSGVGMGVGGDSGVGCGRPQLASCWAMGRNCDEAMKAW